MRSSPTPVDELPQPDEDSIERSSQVIAAIAEVGAASGGVIGFAEYMRIALYHPGSGYYSSGQVGFGEQGDFITAPEVSTLFSRCIANQVAEVLQRFDRGYVIEFGAGSGVMAADILLQLETLGALPEQYLILELSAALQQRQLQTLQQRAGHLLDRVEWISTLPDEPLDAVVLANEVLDAMPVERFRIEGGRAERMMIGCEQGGLYSDYEPASDALAAAVANIESRIGRALPQAYCSEVNLNIAPWLRALRASLSRGLVLLIDYGYPAAEYYLPERDRGTLICHYRHRAHGNPFWFPGLQDISAFVDFSDVAYSATDNGFHVAGFTTQAAFLMGCGLADLHEASLTEDATTRLKLAQQIKTLTLPSEMGEKFRVMGLTVDHDEPLSGFMLQDHRGKL